MLLREEPNAPQRAVYFRDPYHNHQLNDWLTTQRPTWRMEVKNREPGTVGFVVLPQRWGIERTNAWNGRARRHRKDYERRVESSAAMIEITNIRLLLRRLAPSTTTPFSYAQAA